MSAYGDYWKRRAEQRIAERHKYLDASILQINDAYSEAMKELNKDIDKLFTRFLKETGLSREDARKLLQEEISASELDEIREKLESVADEDIKAWLQQKLDAAYYKGRISRLEALKETIRVRMSVLADRELAISTAAYVKAVKDEYYHNIFDSQKYLGFAFSFTELPERIIDQILQDNWSGKHYSKRIWGNTQVMAKQIEKIILKGSMLGTNSRKMARELNKIANTGMYACERLIRTETTYFTAMADLEAAKARGTEKVQFVATLDTRTSPQCRKADGTIIPVEQAQPGKNIPPLHPFCRSVIIDVIEGLVHKVRRARDPVTGKNYLVPGDMTYKDWNQMVRKNGIMLKDDDSLEDKYKVRWDIVNSDVYDQKYENLTGSEEADKAICKYAREILQRRDGTRIEETYLIDAASGDQIAHINGGEMETIIPANVLDILKESNDNSIIMLHNHPSGMSFTLRDIDEIAGVGSIKGIIAVGHNGKVYYAERPPYRSDLADIYKAIRNLYKHEKPIDRRHRTWESVYQIFGAKYERR